MTKEYNQSLELSYEEKNNDLTQDTSLIHNISIENISVENHEKTNTEILNDHLDKLKIEASENESSDLNNLIEECKTVKKDDTNSYSLIISLLNYISRNIMKVNKNFQNISAVKTMINYIFVELEENKNEKIKEILIRMFNFLFCEGELNFNKELFFTKLFKEIKFIKLKEIKNKIKEIKEDVLKSEFLFENLKNEFNKQEEINGSLKSEISKIMEENQKNCKNIAVLEERFNQFSNFINELLRLLNVDGCYNGDLFFTFDKIKEKFIKIQEENETLKNEEKFEKLKNKFDKLFKKAEEENLKKDKEIELLKEKNEKYKDCLKKFKKSYLELVEENENKGQIIKKQACVIDFFKKSSLCDNLSVDQVKEKIEKIKDKLCKQKNEDLKFFMMNDLKDYEKIYCDLVNLKK